jgi:cation transport ATPase
MHASASADIRGERLASRTYIVIRESIVYALAYAFLALHLAILALIADLALCAVLP